VLPLIVIEEISLIAAKVVLVLHEKRFSSHGSLQILSTVANSYVHNTTACRHQRFNANTGLGQFGEDCSGVAEQPPRAALRAVRGRSCRVVPSAARTLPPQPLLTEAHPVVRRTMGRAASAPRLGNGHRGRR